MNWLGLLAAIVATWCGIDIGIATTKKDTKEMPKLFLFFETEKP
jgi:hypothetical protein